MKRLSLLMSVVCFAILTQAAATSGSCGTNATWEFDEWYGLLSIEGSGAMKDYKSSSLPPWHQYKDDIKSIYIEEGITDIGKYAFWECEEVEYVDIPLSLKRIGMNAFAYCKKLDDITVYSNLTTIEGQAFMFCEKLTSFSIPNSVTTFGTTVFSGCKSLSDVVLPNNLTDIPYHTFYNCWALTHITIPSSVISIGESAFFNSGITTIQLPANLKTIDNRAFKGCDDITSLIIPDKVTEIGIQVFYDCNSLQNVTIGKSVTKMGYDAFGYSEMLSKIEFKSATPPTLSGSNNFSHTSSNLQIIVPCGSLNLYQSTYSNQTGISNSNFLEDCSPTLPEDGSVLTCEEAAYYASLLEHNTPTTQSYYVFGYITSTNGVVSYDQQTFWMADKKNGGNVFEIYWGNVSQQLQVGDYVGCHGHLMRYNNISEMKNPHVTLIARQQSIEDIHTENSPQKILHNGNVYILTNDKTYSITGQEVK